MYFYMPVKVYCESNCVRKHAKEAMQTLSQGAGGRLSGVWGRCLPPSRGAHEEVSGLLHSGWWAVQELLVCVCVCIYL